MAEDTHKSKEASVKLGEKDTGICSWGTERGNIQVSTQRVGEYFRKWKNQNKKS